MFAWTRRLFGSWREFFEYLIFLGACVAGVVSASWVWVAVGTLALLLLGWPRWSVLIAKAEGIDAQYRELGALAWRYRNMEYVVRMFGSAYHVALVVGAKVGFDALYLAGAFIFGHVTRWVWFG